MGKSFLFIVVAGLFISCSSELEMDYPLAASHDPPGGEETTPVEAGVYLGRYKTCDLYAEYFKSQVGFFARVFIMSWAQYLQDFSTVQCEVAHTCHCESDQYFAEDFGGTRDPIYRCIEPSSAGVETEEIYAATESFPNEGVIKLALPQSYCEE